MRSGGADAEDLGQSGGCRSGEQSCSGRRRSESPAIRMVHVKTVAHDIAQKVRLMIVCARVFCEVSVVSARSERTTSSFQGKNLASSRHASKNACVEHELSAGARQGVEHAHELKGIKRQISTEAITVTLYQLGAQQEHNEGSALSSSRLWHYSSQAKSGA